MALKILACSYSSFTCSYYSLHRHLRFHSFNRCPNKLAPNVPNNMPRNPPFCYFDSFLVVSLTPVINKPDFLRNLTIFMRPFISSFEIINVFSPTFTYFYLFLRLLLMGLLSILTVLKRY